MTQPIMVKNEYVLRSFRYLNVSIGAMGSDMLPLNCSILPFPLAFSERKSVPLWFSTIILLTFIMICTLVWQLMTKWPVITCVYFAFCTFTTVGFGDINPTERQEKEHELDHANAVDSVEEAKPEEQFNEEQKIMLEVRRNLIWKKKLFFFIFQQRVRF